MQFNFVGRLLGPRGNSLKRVEASTECRVLIRGCGSIKDPARVIMEAQFFNGRASLMPQELVLYSGFFIYFLFIYFTNKILKRMPFD